MVKRCRCRLQVLRRGEAVPPPPARRPAWWRDAAHPRHRVRRWDGVVGVRGSAWGAARTPPPRTPRRRPSARRADTGSPPAATTGDRRGRAPSSPASMRGGRSWSIHRRRGCRGRAPPPLRPSSQLVGAGWRIHDTRTTLVLFAS